MKIKAILLPTLALLIICLVVTAALSVTNHFTKDIIEQKENQAVEEAMEGLVPNASFTKLNDTTYVTGDSQTYIFITQAMGYKSKVEVMTAINNIGQITGVHVINCSEESPGIGQKVGTDTGFLSQFTGQSGKVESIDAITGATYSSVAVKDAINVALEQFQEVLTVSPTNVKGGPNE